MCQENKSDQSQLDEIYPLQQSLFEGVKVNIPNQAENILSNEYGQNALVDTSHHWYFL